MRLDAYAVCATPPALVLPRCYGACSVIFGVATGCGLVLDYRFLGLVFCPHRFTGSPHGSKTPRSRFKHLLRRSAVYYALPYTSLYRLLHAHHYAQFSLLDPTLYTPVWHLYSVFVYRFCRCFTAFVFFFFFFFFFFKYTIRTFLLERVPLLLHIIHLTCPTQLREEVTVATEHTMGRCDSCAVFIFDGDIGNISMKYNICGCLALLGTWRASQRRTPPAHTT